MRKPNLFLDKMKHILLNDKVSVDIIEGPIGLIASGGTDSTLLMYVLMKEHKDPLHIFTCSSNYKGRANALIVPKIIEKCIQLTGNINVIHHGFYVETQDKTNLFNHSIKMLDEGTINALYTGITANPPHNVVQSFRDINIENDERNPDVIRSTWVYNNKMHIPFTNVDKREIAKLYNTLNLNSLFVHTRSCEKVGEIEYYDHCGECWWCEERKWGFGTL